MGELLSSRSSSARRHNADRLDPVTHARERHHVLLQNCRAQQHDQKNKLQRAARRQCNFLFSLEVGPNMEQLGGRNDPGGPNRAAQLSPTC